MISSQTHGFVIIYTQGCSMYEVSSLGGLIPGDHVQPLLKCILHTEHLYQPVIIQNSVVRFIFSLLLMYNLAV